MSQHELPDSKIWRIIEKLDSTKIQSSARKSTGMVRTVISSLCSRSQETKNVRHQPGQGQSGVTIATNGGYLMLTGRLN